MLAQSKPEEALEKMMSLLLLIIAKPNQKRPISWRYFQEQTAAGIRRSIRNFDLLYIPSWKINLIKEQIDMPWFEQPIKKISHIPLMTRCWIKSIVHGWDSLIQQLVDGGKVMDNEVKDIKKLHTHFESIVGPNDLLKIANNITQHKDTDLHSAVVKYPI